MASIKDVAKKAGVSVATVSRVINNSLSVSAGTREIVLKAISDLEYSPNLLGRNLRRKETNIVLVLIPNISNPFYGKVVKGIEDRAHAEGYKIMLCNTDSDVQRERNYIKLAETRIADGIILMAPEISSNEINTLAENIAVVQCCEFNPDSSGYVVTIDNEKAAFDAVSYLIKKGHRRIGMLTSKKKYVSSVLREQGYRRAVEHARIEYDGDMVEAGIYNFKGGLVATEKLLKHKPDITALFCISDMFAAGAIKACKKMGYDVPKDISVIGIDNIAFSYMLDTPITTVSQPRYELGSKAMELILNQIKGGKDVEEGTDNRILLPYELVERSTVVDI